MSYVLISHRGNVDCSYHQEENSQDYIQKAINLGYDVEIDVRKINDKLFLGHDTPDYEVSIEWLLERNNKLWIHTKNFEALSFLIDFNLKTFYHQKENHTIINSCNLIWSHELSESNEKSIIPLLSLEDINNFDNKKVYGICSDFISFLNRK
jgi:hypothetical protein